MSHAKLYRSALFNKFIFTTALASLAVFPLQAQANPWSDFTDEHGTIGIDTSIADHTKINQHGNLYIGNSSNLDIMTNESVTIGQNNTSSMFVAKAHNGSDPTRILGSLATRLKDGGGNFTGNVGGSVMILDTNGIFFGADSQIDTGGIIASTGELNNDRLINEGMVELSNMGDGEVRMNGEMTIAEGGLAAFVAPTVVNNGIITAKAGRVELAGSNTVTTVDLYGDGLLEIAVDDSNVDALLARNNGEIHNEEGVIHMTTGAAEEIVDSTVNLNGIARVDSATQIGGKIVLGGENTGRVRVNERVQARGETGGGEITLTAKDVIMTNNAVLNARAMNNGDGGTITVDASNDATLNGRLRAQGGNNGGDGGTIETSAVNDLTFGNGLEVTAEAANGEAGDWIIDPVDLDIDGGTAAVFGATLDTGTNISAAATNDVMVNAALVWTGIGDLMLDAGRDLLFNSTISGGGDLTGEAGRNVVFANGSATEVTDADMTFTSGDDILVNDGAAVDVTNGTLTMAANNGNGGLSAMEIDGDITVDGGDISLSADDYFIEVNPTGSITQTSGMFTAMSDTGFDMDPGATLDLGSADVSIDAPDVRLGADINTTGAISGTASLVSVENDTAEIQDGVDVSASGATVNVAAGTFEEQIGIDKDLTLQGSGAGATVIASPAALTESYMTASGTYRPVVHVHDTGNVVIDGVTVDGQGFGNANAGFQGVAYHNAGGVLSNSEIVNIGDTPSGSAPHGDAVYALVDDGGDYSLDVEDNMISAYQRNGITFVGEGLSGTIANNTVAGGSLNGIVVENGGNLTISGNTVSGNTDSPANRAASDYTTGIGILVNEATGPITVSDNTVHDNTDGIRVRNSDAASSGDILIEGNALTDNEDKGLILKDSDNVVVSENTMTGNAIGLYLDVSSNAVVDANTISNNDTDGVRLRDGSNNAMFTHNFISGNAGAGVFVDDTHDDVTGLTLLGNSITGDTLVHNDSAAMVDASGNWWGGTDQNVILSKMSGSGDVDYSPYLALGTDTSADAGFQGDFSDLFVTTLGGQTQMDGRINEALFHLADGSLTGADRIIHVMAGEYDENVLVDKSVNLRGWQADFDARTRSGAEAVINGYMSTAANIDGLIVNGFTFVNQGDVVPGFGDMASVALNNNLSNVSIINNKFDGQDIAGSRGVVTSTAGIDNLLVRFNDFQELATGVYINPNANDVDIRQNDFLNNIVGASVDGHARVRGNRFFDNSLEGLGIGGTVDMTNNRFRNNGQHLSYYNGAGPDLETGNNLFFTNGMFKQTADMTLDELFDLEDKVTHKMDNSGYGLVVFNDGNLYVTEDSGSIQRGVDASDAGDTLWVDDGTFSENVTVDKALTINGDGTVATTILNGTGSGAGFTVAADDVSLNGMIVQNFEYGVNVETGIANLSMSDILAQNNTAGLKVSNAGSIDGLTIDDSHFDDNQYGWYLAKDDNNAANLSTVTDVMVTNTTFDNNDDKGLYAEKLDNATFMNVSVTDSGVNAGYDSNAGIDVNLKNGTYENIVFDNVTVSGSGMNGSGVGNAMTVKARNDGATYGATPASLTNLVVRNSDITAGGDVALAVGYGVDGVTVENNDITGPEAVLFYGGVQNAVVDSNTITGTGLSNRGEAYGIAAVGNGGTTTITDNTVNGSGEGYGIWISDTDNSTATGNTVDNFKNGMQIDDGSMTALVEDNTFSNNTDTESGRSASNWTTGVGVMVTGNASDVEIAENMITDNTDGVRVFEAGSGIVVDDNVISGSGDKAIIVKDTDDAEVTDNELTDNFEGIRNDNADNTLIEDNDIEMTTGKAIYLSRASNNVDIVDNEIDDAQTGILVEGGEDNLIDDNDIENVTDNSVHIVDAMGTDVTDNLIQSTVSGAVGVKVEDSTDTQIGGDGTTLRNRIWDVDTGVMVSGGSDTVIDGNDMHRVENGVIAEDTENLTVTDNTITGNSIKGISVSNSDGVLIGGMGDGNTVEDFETGIELADNTDDARVIDNTVTGGDNGIVVTSGSDNALIDDNDVFDTAENGIWVSDSSEAMITDNLVDSDDGTGINVENASDTTVGGIGNTLRNRVRNVETGIKVSGGSDTLVEGNEIDDTGTGIDADSTSGLTVRDNTVNGTVENGIDVRDTVNARIRRNTVSDSGVNGIYVSDSGSVRIRQNRIHDPLANGIVVENSDDARIRGNRVFDAGSNGFAVISSDGVLLRNNRAVRSADDGFLIQSGVDADLINNRARGSGESGFHLFDMTDALVTGNIANNNTNKGIFIDGSTGTEISDNTTNGNDVGIAVRGTTISGPMNGPSDDTLILNNMIANNATAGISTMGNAVNLVTLEGNVLDNNTIGMLFHGGEIDISSLSNPNTIMNGTTGMKFDPVDPSDPLNLVDDTIGGTVFTDQTGNYIELTNGALFEPGEPTLIDGISASYDGVVPMDSPLGAGVLTSEQLQAIEDKIIDFDDDPSLGQIHVEQTSDISTEDFFFLNLFSLGGRESSVSVTFTGMPPVSELDLAALNDIAPGAGGDTGTGVFDLSDPLSLAGIEPAAGSDGAFELASLEPAAGGMEGCWAAAGSTSFDTAVTFNFGGNIESVIDDSTCAQ